MEKAFNIFHYCIYLLLNKLHLFLNRMSPAYLIYKLPYFKEKHKRNKSDPIKALDALWMNKRGGLNLWGASGILCFTIILIFLSLFLILTKGHNVDRVLLPLVIIFMILTIFIISRYIYSRDKYLEYFEEFEHWHKKIRIKYIILCILFVIIVIVLLFASLFFHFS